MTIIDQTVARKYLLERVGELKAQVPHGNPFVFLGAFAVLNAVGRVFNSGIYDLLNKFGDYDTNESEVVEEGARLMYQGFSLTAPVYEDRVGYAQVEKDERYFFTTVGGAVAEEKVKKLNLSHKEREHKKHSKKGHLTLSANSFLEDVEQVINKAFDSVKDDEVAGARLFVKINEQPFIGYGE